MSRVTSYAIFLLSLMTGGFAQIYANGKAVEETSGSVSDFSSIIIVVLQILCLFVVVGSFIFFKTYIQIKSKKIQDKINEIAQATGIQTGSNAVPDKTDNNKMESELLKIKLKNVNKELKEVNELNNELEREICSYKAKIDSLESENKSIRSENEIMRNLDNPSPLNVQANQSKNDVHPKNSVDEYFNQPNLDHFFIETPSEDKTIQVSKLSKEFVQRDHSYEVVIDPSEPNIAKFRICKDAKFDRMIGQPNRYLTPACQCGDTLFEPNKKIETIEAGTLEFSGNVWRLSEKAKVKLI